jgi:hypothetical protein
MGLILGRLLRILSMIIRSNWISIFSRSEVMRFCLRILILLPLWISFKEMLFWRVRIRLRSYRGILIYRILCKRLERMIKRKNRKRMFLSDIN